MSTKKMVSQSHRSSNPPRFMDVICPACGGTMVGKLSDKCPHCGHAGMDVTKSVDRDLTKKVIEDDDLFK